MEDLAPKGEAAAAQWARFREGLGKLGMWWGRTVPLGRNADIVVANYLALLRIVWGDDSQKWKDISSWNDGRCAGIVEALKKYETVAGAM